MVYETGRLILRVLDDSYASKVFEYYYNNKDFLEPWEPERIPGFYTAAFHTASLMYEYLEIHKKNSLRLWIFKKSNPSKIIGCLSFSNFLRGPFQICHIGYKLDKDETDKGYMTEAARKGIDIMFNEYKMHRIEAYIMPNNDASIRVIDKLNFQPEGQAYKFAKIRGKWETHNRYVLINEKLD